MTVQFKEDKQRQRIKELREQEEEGLVQIMSQKYGLPYVDLSVSLVNIDALRTIKESEAREAKVAPFNIVNKRVSLAIISPHNEKTIAVIEDLKKRGYVPNIFMASHQSLDKVWERYKDLSHSMETKSGAVDIENQEIESLVASVKSIADIKESLETILSQKNYRVSKVLEIILAGAISIDASDIHIEPEDGVVRLRYRLDGVLNDVLDINHTTYDLLLSRIKLLSNLKLNIKTKLKMVVLVLN